MSHAMGRKLPSIDWIALGIGVVGLVLSRVQSPGFGSWLGLLGLAVFGPPLLRELGWLQDEDEYVRNIRWRAGFHAAMFAGVAIFLNWVARGFYINHPEALHQKLWLFPMNDLRQNLVVIYLVSFLIQYWGAPRGVFRILLGMAGVLVLDFGMGLAQGGNRFGTMLLPALGFMALFLGFMLAGAWLARRRPQFAGRMILALAVALVVLQALALRTLPPAEETMGWLGMVLGMVSSLISVGMVFAILGGSLLKSEGSDESEE